MYDNFRMHVLVHGREIREYPHQGETYIEGRKGSEFKLRIINDSHERVEAVVTVDGLSVMNGKAGGFNVRGYLVPAFSHIDIPGWRLNMESVAQFFFSALGESYAHQMSKPTNVGVIGCAIFKEKTFKPVMPGLFMLHSPNFRSCRDSQEKGIGTGFGKKTDHRVTAVEFERASTTPAKIITIRYAERNELITMGVDLGAKATIASAVPFPAEVGCVPPTNWRG